MAIVQLIARILALSHSSEKNAVTSISGNPPPLTKESAFEKMRLELATSQFDR